MTTLKKLSDGMSPPDNINNYSTGGLSKILP